MPCFSAAKMCIYKAIRKWSENYIGLRFAFNSLLTVKGVTLLLGMGKKASINELEKIELN